MIKYLLFLLLLSSCAGVYHHEATIELDLNSGRKDTVYAIVDSSTPRIVVNLSSGGCFDVYDDNVGGCLRTDVGGYAILSCSTERIR